MLMVDVKGRTCIICLYYLRLTDALCSTDSRSHEWNSLKLEFLSVNALCCFCLLRVAALLLFCSWLVDIHSIPGAINLLFSARASDRSAELFALIRLRAADCKNNAQQLRWLSEQWASLSALSVKIVARNIPHSQVKVSPLKCCVAKSATHISIQLSSTQLSWDLMAYFQSAVNAVYLTVKADSVFNGIIGYYVHCWLTTLWV